MSSSNKKNIYNNFVYGVVEEEGSEGRENKFSFYGKNN